MIYTQCAMMPWDRFRPLRNSDLSNGEYSSYIKSYKMCILYIKVSLLNKIPITLVVVKL